MKKILLGIVTLLFLGSCMSVSAKTVTYNKNADVVTTSAVYLKKGEGTSTKNIVKLKKGTKLKVQAKNKSEWVKVKTSAGKNGYVQSKYVKKYNAPSKGKKMSGVKITFYCACPDCNGCWSSWRNGAWSTATAKGVRLYNKSSYKWQYCAATPAVGKLGQVITVNLEGKERKLKIVDRLGSSSGRRIDVFYPGHSGCYRLGVRYNKTVYVK